MPPVFALPQPALPHYIYDSLTAFAAKLIAWFAIQSHNISHATTTFLHFISKTAKTIAHTPIAAVRFVEKISVAIAKFLLLLCGGLLGLSLLLSISIALYNNRNRIWSCMCSALQRICLPPTSPATLSDRRRHRPSIFDGTDVLPSYGTMGAMSPGMEVRRVMIEESQGPGWQCKIRQSATRYADGSKEVWVSVFKAWSRE